MIAETLAGIALFKSAVDGIKSAIGTANDVSEIAGFIDNLFEGEKQVQHKRSAKSGVGVADQFGVKSVASEVIDARLAKEQGKTPGEIFAEHMPDIFAERDGY